MDLVLNEKQSQFWESLFVDGTICSDSRYREYALWGGYGAGKTMVFLLSMYRIALLFPRVTMTMIRETYTQLDDTVVSDFNNMFQMQGYKYNRSKKDVVFENGSLLRFRAFDKPEKILGGNIDLICVSQAEQIPTKLFKEIFGRQRGISTLPKKLLFTEGNPSECWAKTRYIDTPLPDDVFFMNLTTYDNRKFLDEHSPDFITTMEKEYDEDERKAKMLGQWNTHSLMVLKKFDQAVNVLPPFVPAKGMRIFIGGDYGYRNPAAFVWACKDFDDNIIIFDEFYGAEQSIDELAKQSKRHGKHLVVYDFSAKRPDRDGKSVWTELESHGVPLIECNKDELRNIAEVNRLFGKGQLFITENCFNLLKEIRGYHWKDLSITSDKNMPEQTQDKNNHAIDSMLYVVAFIQDLRSNDPRKVNKLQEMFSKIYSRSNDFNEKIEEMG